MTEKSYSAVNALVDIFAAPARALDEVRNHVSWLWWPLLIYVGLAMLLVAWYHSWVDVDWLIDSEIQKIPAESRAESADAVRGFMAGNARIFISAASVAIFTLIIYLVYAVWFHLANKLTTGTDIRFGQWFAFNCWTMFPGVIGTLVAFVVIFMADSNQMPAENMQALSLNNLLIHAQPGEDWFNWGNAFSVLNFWVIALMSIGFSRWTSSSMAKSVIVSALPFVLIFGTWALLV
jgi:hypothetical protein